VVAVIRHKANTMVAVFMKMLSFWG